MKTMTRFRLKGVSSLDEEEVPEHFSDQVCAKPALQHGDVRHVNSHDDLACNVKYEAKIYRCSTRAMCCQSETDLRHSSRKNEPNRKDVEEAEEDVREAHALALFAFKLA
jgi:hypothetical protein